MGRKNYNWVAMVLLIIGMILSFIFNKGVKNG